MNGTSIDVPLKLASDPSLPTMFGKIPLADLFRAVADVVQLTDVELVALLGSLRRAEIDRLPIYLPPQVIDTLNNKM